MNDTDPNPDQHDVAVADSQARRRLHDELAAQFPAVPAAVLDDHIDRAVHQFDEASVRDYLPVLITRTVQAELADGDEPEALRPEGA